MRGVSKCDLQSLTVDEGQFPRPSPSFPHLLEDKSLINEVRSAIRRLAGHN